MTSDDRPRRLSPGQLHAGLIDLAGSSPPDYRDDILRQVARTRQRPAWTLIERWLPVSIITARSTASPPMRAAWMLLLVGLLTAALVTSLAIVGSQLLRDSDPNRLNGGLMVPTLSLDETWDATTIPGLSQPSGLDVGPDGNLYVVNAGASEILVLAPDGSVVRRWGERGAGEGQFFFQQDSQVPSTTIGGVAVAPDGSVYVADTVNDRVQQLTGDGTFLRAWGGHGPGDGQFLNPFDVAIDEGGNVVVADFVRDDLQRFGPEGTHLQTIGTKGMVDGQLWDTGGVAVDAAGDILNADYGNDRLQAFTPEGTFRWSVGREAGDPVKLAKPGDVAIDGEGFIYVTEADRLTVLTPDRQVASTWDLPDGGAAEEWLPIAVADDGTVYLSAEYRGVIYKLRSVARELDVDQAAALETPTADGSGPPAAPSPAVASPAAAGSGSAMTAAGLRVGRPFAVPFTADQPEGWVVNWLAPPGGVELALMQVGSTEYIQAAVRVFVPTNAYADACESGAGPIDPPIGPTVDDLVTALLAIPGFLHQSPVTDITIDGYQGKTFEVESTQVLDDCPDDGAWLPMWTFEQADGETFAGPGSNFHQRIAILDVEGTRVLIEAWTFDDSSRDLVSDTNRVFESIDFE